MTFRVHIANASDAISACQEFFGFSFQRYNQVAPLQIFHFGSYGDTHVAVWDQNIEDGLETAAEWLAENAPGLIYDAGEMEELYADAARDLGLEGPVADFDEDDIERVREAAEAGLTYTESGYIPSHEWGVSDLAPGDEDFRRIFEQSIEELTDLTDEDDEWWVATGISAFLGPMRPRLEQLKIFPIGDFDDDELGVMLDAVEEGNEDALEDLGWEIASGDDAELDAVFHDVPYKYLALRFVGDE